MQKPENIYLKLIGFFLIFNFKIYAKIILKANNQ